MLKENQIKQNEILFNDNKLDTKLNTKLDTF